MDKIFTILGLIVAVLGIVQAASKKKNEQPKRSTAWRDADPSGVPASVPQGRQAYEGRPVTVQNGRPVSMPQGRPAYEDEPVTVQNGRPASVSQAASMQPGGLRRGEMERDRLTKADTKATTARASAKPKGINPNITKAEPAEEKDDSPVETNENAKRFIAALQKQPLLVQGITMSEILNKPLCDRQ